MDIGQLLITLLSGGAATYGLGWITGRKKTRADIKSVEATTEKTEAETEQIRVEKLLDTISIYEHVHDALKEQLNLVAQKCTELSEKITQLSEENKILTEKINEAGIQNELLQREIHILREQLKK